MDEDSNKKRVQFEDEPEAEEESATEAEELGRQFNKFQFLEVVENPEATSDDELEKVESDQDDQPKPTSSSKSKSKSKRRNKNKRSQSKQNRNSSSENPDDLFVVSDNNQKEQDTNEGELAYWSSDCHLQLIKVDVRHLTPDNELVRMFGKSVIKEERAKEAKSRHQILTASGNIRSRFVSSGYHDNKAILLTPGPKMELDDRFNRPSPSENNTGDTRNQVSNNKNKNASNKKSGLLNDKKPLYFRFVHEKSYQTAHNMFLDCAQRGYSDGIIDNLNLFPTHVESLIQLSDMVRVSEDYKAASELIERALLLFERGFHQLFNLGLGNCRLSYKRPENRSFFITIFKHIQYLSRRGLRRTPLEYTKLLLTLEPDNDPLFAILLIDFYAIRSEEYDFLIDFIAKWQHASKLPNMNFSLALAHFMKSKSLKHGKSVSEANLKLADEYLQQALIRYPNFIVPLLDACSAEPDSELQQSDYFNYTVYSKKYKLVPESVDLLVSLYIERNLILWKNKDVLAWLERNVALLVKKFATKELLDNGQHLEYWSSFRGVLPRNLLRHIVLSDLKVKVPQSAASSTNLDIDPFPPHDSIISYSRDNPLDSADGNRSETYPSSLGFSSLFIRSILPSFGLGGGEGGTGGAANQSGNNQSNHPNNR